MKINSIKLENFKFYTKQYFSPNNKNIILYGENGSGKSSLYWALHNFYKALFSNSPNKYLDGLDSTQDNSLANHNTKQDAKIEITFNGVGSIALDKNGFQNQSVIDTSSINTIHFLNHKKLYDLLANKKNELYNFFTVLNDELMEKFVFFLDLQKEYNNALGAIQTNQNLQQLNNELARRLNNLQTKTNDTLRDIFKENLNIEFVINDNFTASMVGGTSTWQIENPTILLKINDNEDFLLRLNEARLKLVSMVIYLVLMIDAKRFPIQNNQLKLIVLDDILLSLDMAQRTKILDFIFQEFLTDYQIFIFTHDIFFYDLVKRKIMHFENITDFKQTKWEDRFVFSRENPNGYFEPIIYKADDDFLERAKKNLTDNDLAECGNNLRKEIEKILHQMMIDFEIGKRGELYRNIEVFAKLNYKNLYKEPQKVLEDVMTILEDTTKADTIKNQEILDTIQSSIKIDLTKLKKILHGFQWHRHIIGNASSHATQVATYRTEFQQAILDITTLKTLIKGQ